MVIGWVGAWVRGIAAKFECTVRYRTIQHEYAGGRERKRKRARKRERGGRMIDAAMGRKMERGRGDRRRRDDDDHDGAKYGRRER